MKLPEPVAMMETVTAEGHEKPNSMALFWPEDWTGNEVETIRKPWGIVKCHKLYTEAQLREALASHEAVMRMALEALKVFRQGFRSPYTAPAIAALEEQLK